MAWLDSKSCAPAWEALEGLYLEKCCVSLPDQEHSCTGRLTLKRQGANAGAASRSQGRSSTLRVGLLPACTDSKGRLEQTTTRKKLVCPGRGWQGYFYLGILEGMGFEAEAYLYFKVLVIK